MLWKAVRIQRHDYEPRLGFSHPVQVRAPVWAKKLDICGGRRRRRKKVIFPQESSRSETAKRKRKRGKEGCVIYARERAGGMGGNRTARARANFASKSRTARGASIYLSVSGDISCLFGELSISSPSSSESSEKQEYSVLSLSQPSQPYMHRLRGARILIRNL